MPEPLEIDEWCVVCGEETDTGLAFTGEGEVALGGLKMLGVPLEQAFMEVRLATGLVGTGYPKDAVPRGKVTVAFPVCAACAERSGTGIAVGRPPDIPIYASRDPRYR